MYSGDIPAAPDGDFVTYFIEATDNTGAKTTSDNASYRVLTSGINSVSDIQLTAGGNNGPSPFDGVTAAMNINGVVNSTPGTSGFMIIQDDPGLAPWTGIIVEIPDGMTFEPGDGVQITNGTITEIRQQRFDRSGDVTGIGSPTITKTSTGTPYGYKTLTTDMLVNVDNAESYENMMVRFENVNITNNDVGFGEWAFSSDGTSDNEILADDASPEFSSSFSTSTFNNGDLVPHIQGVWTWSFGTFKVVPELASDVSDEIVPNEPIDDTVPNRFTLHQNYPNPFNPTTAITYEVAQTGTVTLEVFDILGKKVATLVDDVLTAGTYRATFDARPFASGMYLYRLSAGTKVLTKKMLLMK